MRNDWFDRLGAWWLMACAFGALAGWLTGQIAARSAADPFYFHVGKIFLTMILPFATMLPNARYVSRNAAYVQIPLLTFITALPMFIGFSSVIWLWEYYSE